MNWKQTQREEFEAQVGDLVRLRVRGVPEGGITAGGTFEIDESRTVYAADVSIEAMRVSHFYPSGGPFSTPAEAKAAALRRAFDVLAEAQAAVMQALAEMSPVESASFTAREATR